MPGVQLRRRMPGRLRLIALAAASADTEREVHRLALRLGTFGRRTCVGSRREVARAGLVDSTPSSPSMPGSSA